MKYEEAIKPKWFIILPDSKIRNSWNLFVLMLLMYTATFVPYRTSFVSINGDSIEPKIELFVDAMYVLDLYLNFFMAYEDKDRKIEVRGLQCAANYCKTWLFFDLLACIPFQFLEPLIYPTGNQDY
jgi:hypothetical protein